MAIYRGRQVTREDIAWIRQFLADRPEWSRWKLSRELCQAWQWKQANGAWRDMVCRGLLLMLHRTGEIELPPVKRVVRNRIAERARPARVLAEERALQGSLGDLQPLEFVQVRRTPEEPLFHSLMQAVRKPAGFCIPLYRSHRHPGLSANSLFHHRPEAVSRPPAKIEVAYHKADAAIPSWGLIAEADR